MRKHDFTPVLLALLLAGLCLVHLTGCTGKEPDPAEQSGPAAAPDPGPDTTQPAAPADGPLTEEELQCFNEEFFNGDSMNIRNQFLLSVYETAADVSLFELFYNGTGQDETMTDEEWAAFEAAGGFVETDVTKVSTIRADAVLKENTGLTLAETSRVGLDAFIYLPEYDAYYMAHGDTNYWEVSITSGERAEGLIHLFYDDEYSGSQKCVTLRETEDGGYQFVSNLRCDGPAG